MKKLLSLILLGMVVSGNGYAMGWILPNNDTTTKMNKCTKQTNNCWVEDATQSMGKRLDDKCVNDVYCSCHKEFTPTDTISIQRYCK
jgi:hypothetical protein